MREIKFRAYGTINTYYLTDNGWKPKTMMCEVSSLNIKTNKCRVLFKGERGNDYDTLNLSECKLMQFTSLKDKNGVDIYEGDIVTYKRSVGNWTGQFMTTTHEIVFSEEVFAYVMKYGSSYIKLRKHWGYEYEVIGNIYYNPNLLQ